MVRASPYRLLSWDLLSNSYAQDVHIRKWESLVGHELLAYFKPFELKSCETLWLFDMLDGLTPKRVLDVGPQNSPTPQVIAEDYGCEMWAIDKYGDRREYAKERYEEIVKILGYDPLVRHNRVKYVNAFMGEFTKELPDNYFDVVYSVSTLEHVPFSFMGDVFRDMDRVLAPAGHMIHAIDFSIPLGTSRSLAEKFEPGKSERAAQLRKLPLGGVVASVAQRIAGGRSAAPIAIAGELLYHWLMKVTASVARPHLFTTAGWMKFLRSVYAIDDFQKISGNGGALYSLLSHDVLVESVRGRFEWPPANTPKPYWPISALLFVLQKQA